MRKKLKCFTRGTMCEIPPAEQRHTINTFLQENILDGDLIFHSAALNTNTKAGNRNHSRVSVGVRHTRRHFERGTLTRSVQCKTSKVCINPDNAILFLQKAPSWRLHWRLHWKLHWKPCHPGPRWRPQHPQAHSLAKTLGSRRLMGGQVNASLCPHVIAHAL